MDERRQTTTRWAIAGAGVGVVGAVITIAQSSYVLAGVLIVVGFVMLTALLVFGDIRNRRQVVARLRAQHAIAIVCRPVPGFGNYFLTADPGLLTLWRGYRSPKVLRQWTRPFKVTARTLRLSLNATAGLAVVDASGQSELLLGDGRRWTTTDERDAWLRELQQVIG